MVEFTSDASDTLIVHENQSAMITVQVTVFGSLSGENLLSLVLCYGDGGFSDDMSINRMSGTQHLQIPTSDQLNCTTSEIQVIVTTNDPQVELQGNRMFSINIGKKFNQFAHSIF